MKKFCVLMYFFFSLCANRMHASTGKTPSMDDIMMSSEYKLLHHEWNLNYYTLELLLQRQKESKELSKKLGGLMPHQYYCYIKRSHAINERIYKGDFVAGLIAHMLKFAPSVSSVDTRNMVENDSMADATTVESKFSISYAQAVRKSRANSLTSSLTLSLLPSQSVGDDVSSISMVSSTDGLQRVQSSEINLGSYRLDRQRVGVQENVKCKSKKMTKAVEFKGSLDEWKKGYTIGTSEVQEKSNANGQTLLAVMKLNQLVQPVACTKSQKKSKKQEVIIARDQSIKDRNDQEMFFLQYPKADELIEKHAYKVAEQVIPKCFEYYGSYKKNRGSIDEHVVKPFAVSWIKHFSVSQPDFTPREIEYCQQRFVQKLHEQLAAKYKK